MDKNASNIRLSAFTSSHYFVKNSLLSSPYGILKLDRFIVYITLPGFLSSETNESTLSINAISASVPSINNTVSETDMDSIKFYTPIGRDDDTFSITFLEDGSMRIRRIFFSWLEKIFSRTKQERYYFDEFKSNKIEIAPLLPNNQTLYAHIFRDAFPINISDLNFDVQNNTEFARTTISFKYVYHDIGPSSIS